MTRNVSFKDYLGLCAIFVVMAFLATKGRQHIEIQKSAEQAERIARQAQNVAKRRAKIAAWKAKRAGLTGPRIVYLPYQEPLPDILKPKQAEKPKKEEQTVFFQSRFQEYFRERQ